MSHRPAVSIVSVLATLLAWTFLPTTAFADDAGVIKVSKGTASIERSGQRLPVPVGTKVRESDVVTTGADGSVGITFGDNSLLSIGPDSSLVIDRFAFDSTTHKGAFETSLNRGTLAESLDNFQRYVAEQIGGKPETPQALEFGDLVDDAVRLIAPASDFLAH